MIKCDMLLHTSAPCPRQSWAPSPPNMTVDWVGFSYAVLVTSGGLLGYVKAGQRLF